MIRVRQSVDTTKKDVDKVKVKESKSGSTSASENVTVTTTRESLPNDIYSEVENASYNSQTNNDLQSNAVGELNPNNAPSEAPQRSVEPGERSTVQVQTGIPGIEEYTEGDNSSEEEEEYSFYAAAVPEGVLYLNSLVNTYYNVYNTANLNIPNNFYNFFQFDQFFNPTSLSSLLTKSLDSKQELDIKTK